MRCDDLAGHPKCEPSSRSFRVIAAVGRSDLHKRRQSTVACVVVRCRLRFCPAKQQDEQSRKRTHASMSFLPHIIARYTKRLVRMPRPPPAESRACLVLFRPSSEGGWATERGQPVGRPLSSSALLRRIAQQLHLNRAQIGEDLPSRLPSYSKAEGHSANSSVPPLVLANRQHNP